jgi:hypothetical protein
MVSSTSAVYNLTVHNTASGAYSLKAMTVVVVIFLLVVLVNQTWTYYVFRKRIDRAEFLLPPVHPGAESPGSSAAGDPARARAGSDGNDRAGG